MKQVQHSRVSLTAIACPPIMRVHGNNPSHSQRASSRCTPMSVLRRFTRNCFYLEFFDSAITISEFPRSISLFFYQIVSSWKMIKVQWEQ